MSANITKETVNSLVFLAFGLLIVIGVIVGVSALKTNQEGYACSNASHTGNSSEANCYGYGVVKKNVVAEHIPLVSLTKTSNLTYKTNRQANCTIVAAMNASNSKFIPASNWTEVAECSIRHTKGALYNNKNWTVNYTTNWYNWTASTYNAKYSSAWNVTNNVEALTNGFGGQLSTVGIMFGVGLILAAISVVGIGLFRKVE